MYSVTIAYDVDAQALKFFEGSTEKPFGTLLLKDQFAKASQFEELIGNIVLAALSSGTGRSIGFRDYKAQRNAAVSQVVEHFSQRLKEGHQEAIVTIVHELWAAAVRNRDAKYLAQAEQALQEAVSSGNPRAVEYLADRWPQDKVDCLKLIESE